MDKSNKELLAAIEKTARKQRSFTLSSLSEVFPKDDRHSKAITAFFESAIVKQNGGRGRCVPTGQRGGTKKYSEVASLLEKGYAVYVELVDVKRLTGYLLPGEGMRAQIISIEEFHLPEPCGLAQKTFSPIIRFTLDFSGFNKYNKHLASAIDYPKKNGEIHTVSLMNSSEYPEDEKIQLETFGTLSSNITPFNVIGVTCCR